jgi:chitinase
MRKNTLPDKNMIVAYWLNAELTNTFACPPLRDVACFVRKDGATPQIDVINLVGATFACEVENFAPPYIKLAPSLVNALENGDIGMLHNVGIKVVLCVQGAAGCVQWSSVPKDKAQDFANWVNQNILQRYSLDGIDIDDEYGTPGTDDQLYSLQSYAGSNLPIPYRPAQVLMLLLFHYPQR